MDRDDRLAMTWSLYVIQSRRRRNPLKIGKVGKGMILPIVFARLVGWSPLKAGPDKAVAIQKIKSKNRYFFKKGITAMSGLPRPAGLYPISQSSIGAQNHSHLSAEAFLSVGGTTIDGVLLRLSVGILIGILFFSPILHSHALIPSITLAQAEEIGNRIWQNECAGRVDQLTFWNKNEPFPSFGIGHFIWFPEDYHGPYTPMFPSLITYLKKNKIVIPQWIQKSIFCPWKNRNIFYEHFNTQKMKELRNLLASTVALQAQFVVQDFKKNIKKVIKAVAHNERKKVKQHLALVAHSSGGLYALIDYKNFKGWGTNLKESYQGHRWGLLQVLYEMEGNTQSPCKALSDAAKKLLEKRVALAPIEKPEKQFLVGWCKRLNTYHS